MDVAEFQLTLRRWNADYYEAEGRWQPPGDAAVPAPVRQLVAADLRELDLRRNAPDFRDYGRLLSKVLFTPEKSAPVTDRFREALAWLRDPDHAADAVRFRLFIDEGSPELHGVRWETLHD